MSMETLNWMGNKGHACITYIISTPCIEVMKKKRNNRKKTIHKNPMYINTTVTPVSFFFSQSGILVTGSNHKHRQDNHIPSGEDWAKKEGIMSATIYPSPTPPFLGGSQQLKQPCTLQSTSDTSLGRLWIK